MQINSIIEKFKVPDNIQLHSKKVTQVAKQIAAVYLLKGYQIDLEALSNACMLHDLFKIVDFSEEIYEKLIKTATSSQIETWNKMRQKYSSKSHWEAAFEYLNEIDLKTEALMIKKHYFNAILDKSDIPSTLEEKILTYADKRVLHDKVVSMKQRFEDGSKRYNNNGLDAKDEQEIHNAYFQLEKELFAQIDLNPEDIKA